MISFTKSSFFPIAILLTAVLFLMSCDDDNGPTRTELDFSTVPEPYDLSEADTTYIKEGVEIYVIEEGYGQFEVNARDQIFLKYTGRVLDEQIFESTYANGETGSARIDNLRPYDTQVQRAQIEGFRRGLLGMVEGEKRVIIVPDSLGYDDSRPGVRDFDLRDKTLRYDVELTGISGS